MSCDKVVYEKAYPLHFSLMGVKAVSVAAQQHLPERHTMDGVAGTRPQDVLIRRSQCRVVELDTLDGLGFSCA